MTDEQDRFTRSGKEVLFDGAHFADAASEDAAETIRIVMQHGRVSKAMTTAEIGHLIRFLE